MESSFSMLLKGSLRLGIVRKVPACVEKLISWGAAYY
ncbi:hypothetical protein COLO4_00485 [Corchorus olitorius]|uniref:Uncharacterized protein n=1 Tax=Corchorus olitorius TaxID=93759 RepID=A0A1R3L3S3_9ROSI|nr:hypothetical protein COLO4_00485 [Corchorus olitorius]